MKKLWRKIILGFTFLLIIVAVLFFGWLMRPVHDGTSADFWNHACGVDIGAKTAGCFGGVVYQPRDGWYIYYLQGFHGQSLYKVKPSEIISDYPKVLIEIEQAVKKENAAPILRWAYEVIEKNRSQIENNPEKFLSLIRELRLAKLKKKHEDSYNYLIAKEKAFNTRWARMKRFWMNLVFEVIFFIGLLFFILYPWIFKKGLKSKLIHIGLIPLLLFMPYYLGYAGWTFTSAGPSGGALYPWVIIWFYGCPVWTSLDQWILVNIPKVLEPLSQPLGPMLSISGGRPLGPVVAIILGIVISLIVWAVVTLPLSKKKKTR